MKLPRDVRGNGGNDPAVLCTAPGLGEGRALASSSLRPLTSASSSVPDPFFHCLVPDSTY